MSSFPNLSSLYLVPALALLSQQSLSPLAFWPAVSVMYRRRDYVANRLHPEGCLTFLTLTKGLCCQKVRWSFCFFGTQAFKEHSHEEATKQRPQHSMSCYTVWGKVQAIPKARRSEPVQHWQSHIYYYRVFDCSCKATPAMFLQWNIHIASSSEHSDL